MTEQSAAHDAVVTDRGCLAGSAYNSDRDLAARQSLYRWQTPRYGVDAALALHMLYHVPDIAQAVRELSRVVARDGMVIVSTNSDRDKAELDDLWQRAAGDVLGAGRGPARISLSARFSLEKAPAFLREEFGRVETVELPGTITVHDPAPVIAHMASYRAWADQHDVPFEATIERARAILVDHIAQHGTFEVTCLGGILVCHR